MAFREEPMETFLDTLSTIDFGKIQLRQKELREQQKKRGLKRRIIHQTKQVLDELYNDW